MEISKKKKGSKGGRGCKVLLALLLLPGLAFAQDDISAGDVIGNGRYLGAKTSDGQTTVPVLGVDASGNTQINALSGKGVVAAIAKTPAAVLNSQGWGSAVAPNVAVFIATPVAGTNKLIPGYNVPAATATASTKVFVGEAIPTPGTTYEFYNQSAATLHLAVPTVSTLNGATQGGYVAVASKGSATCKTVSGTNIDCRLNVNPTPAGP